MRRRVALGGLLAIGTAVHAADWHLSPVVILNSEYDSNPWLGHTQVPTIAGGLLDVTMPLQAKTERGEFDLIADARVFRYDRSLFDHDDERLDASFKDVGLLATLAATANATRDTTLTSELGTTGLTGANKERLHYEAAFSPQFQVSELDQLLFDLRGETNHYQDAAFTGLVNYSYTSALAGYLRQWSPPTSVGLSVHGGALSVPSITGAASTDYMLRLDITHNYTERLSLVAFAGPTLVRQDGVQRWGEAGQLNIRYVGLLTDFSLRLNRQLAPTGSGALTVQDAASLIIEHRFTARLSSATTITYLDTRYSYSTTTTNARVYAWRVDQTLGWYWTEHAQVRLAASETQQGATYINGRASRVTASLGINWTPKRIF